MSSRLLSLASRVAGSAVAPSGLGAEHALAMVVAGNEAALVLGRRNRGRVLLVTQNAHPEREVEAARG